MTKFVDTECTQDSITLKFFKKIMFLWKIEKLEKILYETRFQNVL